MNKLILATSMIGLALVTTQAQAGSHKNLKSKPPQTACDCSNCSAQHCQPPSVGQQFQFALQEANN
jgi:hypothetical protein